MRQVRGVLGLWRDFEYWVLGHEDGVAMAGLFVVLIGLAWWLIHWFFGGA